MRSYIAFLTGSLLLAFGGVAFAQVNDSLPNADELRGKIRDRVDQIDRDAYVRLNVEKRFNVKFHEHMKVCDESVSGEVHCNARVVTDNAFKPLVTSKAITGMGAAQFLKAYELTGQSTAAKPPVIAIVDAFDHPRIQSDLNTYSAAMGIPALPACVGGVANSATPCFKKVDQRGGTRYPRTNSGWALEIALDVEVAHAVCQNCSILLVEADSNSYSNLMAAVDRAVALGANVVSNSYGGGEFSGETSLDSHFNHPGVAFTVSAGDAGYGAEYPAASRFVTAVGGTSLFLNPDGSYNQEVTWAGTGSGCSAFESKPAWQSDTGCPRRTIADVSAVADPNTGAAVYDSVSYFGQSGWFQLGGTSLASPIIAAIYALSGNTSGDANQLPYTLGNATNLHDIVAGSNGSCGFQYLCGAFTGYDGPTGLGTPKGVTAL